LSIIPLVVRNGLEEPIAEVHVWNGRPVAVGRQQDLKLDPLIDGQLGEALLGLLVSGRAALSHCRFRHGEEGDDHKNPTHHKNIPLRQICHQNAIFWLRGAIALVAHSLLAGGQGRI
jgi:hypothetical protein